MTHTPGFEEQVKDLIARRPEEVRALDAAPEALGARSGSTRRARRRPIRTMATALAGYIVSARLGRAVRRLCRAPHLRAAGHGAFDLPPAAAANLKPLMAEGYQPGKDKPYGYEFVGAAPAGSLAATGDDMGRFMIAHLQNGSQRPEHPEARDGAADALARQRADPGLQTDGARLLRDQHQRHAGDRARRRHGRLPQRPAPVPRQRRRHLRVVQQRRQGRRRQAAARALFEEFADRYFPEPATPRQARCRTTPRRMREKLAGIWSTSRRLASRTSSASST